MADATSALSSSIEARGKLLRRKEGVANFLLDALDVPTSSSRLRFSGVPANASRKNRLLEDCGVLDKAGSTALCLLGVPATRSSEGIAFADSVLEGVPAIMSKIPSTCPSLCGVGPNWRRTWSGVGSSSRTGERTFCCACLRLDLEGVCFLGVAAGPEPGFSCNASRAVVGRLRFCGVLEEGCGGGLHAS